MDNRFSRRDFTKTAACSGLAFLPFMRKSDEKRSHPKRGATFPLCLNSSTIRPTAVRDKIRIAAETGWDAIELWMDDLEKHEAEGGSLKELGVEIKERGLFVPNVIGLWNSIPATEAEFEESLPATRNRMRMASEVGSNHVAAIPTPDRADFDLKWGADCYRELLRIGREDYGITVAIEFVGFFKGVHRLGQACAMAIDADDPSACLIADTFHLFRGGSGFHGIKHLNGALIADFHWNDVSDDVPREQQADEHRLLPGDGILPLGEILRDLVEIGYQGPLSLEVFRRDLWKQDPRSVAEEGLRKMRECVAQALA